MACKWRGGGEYGSGGGGGVGEREQIRGGGGGSDAERGDPLYVTTAAKGEF